MADAMAEARTRHSRLVLPERILRPEQLPPDGDWLLWLIEAGRGWGKTLTGAEWMWRQAENVPRIAVVAPTFGDGRDFCVEGETGLRILHPEIDWNRSMGELTFPSGCRGKVFSGEEPDRLRGPNNYAAWCDEFGSWRYQRETWDMLMFTLRKGEARTLITTTPRKSKLLRELEQRPTTVLVRRPTYDNIANLSPAYIENIIKPYEGTRLGKQELEAVVLDDVPGALWSADLLQSTRVYKVPDLVRVVIGVDPEATSGEQSAETGIVVAGVGADGHGYVLADGSIRGTPNVWGSAVVREYHAHKADRIVAEVNQGGEMVELVIRTVDPKVSYRGVHASRGKQARAEPVAALYERGMVHHIGAFPPLEDQMTSWVPGEKSPDRVDALVWALTDLMLGGEVTSEPNTIYD